MRHIRLCGNLLCLTTLAVGINATAAQGQTTITATVVAAGATEASGGGMIARGTVGQPVIGQTGNAATTDEQGFWFAVAAQSKPSAVPGETTTADEATLRLQCAPNPATSTLHLYLNIPGNTRVSLRLYDALGRTAMTLLDGTLEQGESVVNADLRGVPPGYYTAELVAGKSRTTEQVIVVE